MMKIKTSIKIVSIFTLVMLLILAVLPTTVFGISMDIRDFQGSTSQIGNALNRTANTIIGIIQIVGVGVAVIMLIVLGIKFVTAAPTEKAAVKKGLLYYLIGAILVLATTGVLQIVKGIGKDVMPTETVHYTPGQTPSPEGGTYEGDTDTDEEKSLPEDEWADGE